MDRGLKHAVIVGYGSGLGAAVARRFAQAGFSLALIARDAEKLASAAAAYAGQGIEAHDFPADAGNAGALAGALDLARRRLGDPDVLVYNAAAWRPGPVLALTPEALEEDFRICVSGALIAARVVAPAMAAARRGTILLTGGGFALYPTARAPSLSIGKAGLRALALMLAEELTPQGVKVATITIMGVIAEGTPFAPAQVAAAFLAAHESPSKPEIRFDGAGAAGFQLN
jgi:short-subunit dehydrogenase